MNGPITWPMRVLRILLVGAMGASVWLSGHVARAYTPESPEVRKMVEKGLAFLTQSPTQFSDGRLGAKCLQALCFLKHYKMLKKEQEAKNLPLVKAALDACNAANLKYSRLDFQSEVGISNYSLGVALMFLCEHDPVENRPLIEKYVAELMRRQKPEGGWGYEDEQTGDTSQTQYAVLGMWMAQKVAKIDIPIEAQEACAGWLMRTQSTNGGWAYQGKDPGTLTRIDQGATTLSLSAAGCGSLYIMADLLQVTKSAAEGAEQSERPGPFKEIEERVSGGTRKKGPLTKKLNPATINSYLTAGNSWFRQNYNIEGGNWQHYYMYALERYESFKDKAVDKENPEPKWYNEGVNLLQKTQQMDGSWAGQDTPANATSFAILFLLRSTKVVIDIVTDLGSGVQKGGYRFPPDVANIQERDGEVVGTSSQGSIDQVLDILKSGNSPEILRMIEEARELKLDGNVTKRQSQIESLRRFVSDGNRDVRLVAVSALGKVRGLDNVPMLLYALTDPDVDVVKAADQALRFVSRKLDGVGLPSEPIRDDIKAAQAAWKAWYLSVKPDAELLD